jgi:hypothetical protein
MIKKFLLVLLVALIAIQFFHPARNMAEGAQPNFIGNKYPVPQDVKAILAKACYDCHSNNTRYPWYSKLQPIDWWITDHIREGKKEFNFDEFLARSPRYQYNKIHEVAELAEKHKMPLNSYLWIHKDAKLTEEETKKLVGWADSVHSNLEAQYPMDSLVRKKKPS